MCSSKWLACLLACNAHCNYFPLFIMKNSLVLSFSLPISPRVPPFFVVIRRTLDIVNDIVAEVDLLRTIASGYWRVEC